MFSIESWQLLTWVTSMSWLWTLVAERLNLYVRLRSYKHFVSVFLCLLLGSSIHSQFLISFLSILCVQKMIFCFVLTQSFSCVFTLTGGWHDGATAVCLWVLGQTVSLHLFLECLLVTFLRYLLVRYELPQVFWSVGWMIWLVSICRMSWMQEILIDFYHWNNLLHHSSLCAYLDG